MDPRERHLAILNGDEPDKVHVMASDGLRGGPPGGWMRRMMARGMGLNHIVPPYRPMFFYDSMIDPGLEDIVLTKCYFIENKVQKIRYSFETPIGTINAVVGRNPEINLLTNSGEEYFIKKNSDWNVINYIFRRMTESMKPNYEEMILDQDTLGETGTTIGVVDKTPFQRAWIELAGLQKTVEDSHDAPEEFLLYLETQRKFHERAAEITAGCPVEEILLIDNITNVISPRYYREFCTSTYEIYMRAISETGKVMAVHHDGLLRQLKGEIARAPFKIIDSFTVPPVGNMTLTEAKESWPDKILFINLAPHMAYAGEAELHEGYERILDEWGSKRLVIEHVEDLPAETLERHISAVLDVCGY